ncbi:MAG: hypothetical protein A2Y95_07665 [Deltaproteobacteria bacterium RBG_13_65_10]|nr:MAG: hypothetical protein A2Y95_07665 [Deltaproteobacteria bacterium RBG_13_65_10]
MSPRRQRPPVKESAADIVEARWAEGQAHLASAGVELLLALRAAVSVPIDMAEIRNRKEARDGSGTPRASGAAGWRLLREAVDGAVARLRTLGSNPSRVVRRETLGAIQDALEKELAQIEQGAMGRDAAILAEAFRSVKAIIDRQMELLDDRPPKGPRSPRRARKVTVE